MKAVILAGGMGTRITEESRVRPKPMAEIGGRPILWHIMKLYGQAGINDFIICAGYLQHVIKRYFMDYFLNEADVTFDFTKNGAIRIEKDRAEPWRVTVADTGHDTMTGGRVLRVKDYVGNETFMLTYGDAVCDVDIRKLLAFHRSHGKIATLTTVKSPQQKGVIDIMEGGSVKSFREKPISEGIAINAGFMVLEPEAFDYLEDDSTVLEKGPMQALAEDSQLMAYEHEGFWQCMDTMREKDLLERLWASGEAPWKTWR